MVGWRFICAGILLMAGLAAIPAGGTAGQEAPADPAPAPAGLTPAVDYLVSEYGLDEAVAAEQVEFSAVMEERTPEIRSAFGDSFAGAWIDNSIPGTLYVASTQPDGAATVLADLGIAATIRDVSYSQADLDSGLVRLWDLLREGYPAAPESDFGFRVAVDIQANEIDLELAPYYPITPELEDTIAGFTPHIDVKSTDGWEPGVDEACDDRYNCWPDLRAGLHVRGQNSPHHSCTLGYTMRRDAVRYVSTAGHCTGSPWEHDSINIGSTLASEDSGEIDFKIIDIDNHTFWDAKPWVFRPANHAVHVTSQINIPDASLEGITLCVSGINGQKCGELVDYSASHGDNYRQGKINVNACDGDSGGPVYNYYTDKAYGTHVSGSDGCGGAGSSYFTWIAAVEYWTLYRLVFAD